MRTKLLALALSLIPAFALAAPKVVTTTEGLASLAREVAGRRAWSRASRAGSRTPTSWTRTRSWP